MKTLPSLRPWRQWLVFAVLSTTLALAHPPLLSAVEPYDHYSEATYRQLTWDDFRGPGPDTANKRWTSISGAQVATAIKVSSYRPQTEPRPGGEGFASNTGDIQAYAVVDKNFSGVAPSARRPELLAHEQLHFDLAEAWARRLNGALRSLSVEAETAARAEIALNQSVIALTQEHRKGLQEMQARYDEETGHGMRKKHQKRWAEEISRFLAESPASALGTITD